ncbi:baculoviral IAP repeat-containing protein 7-like protein [Dinothrombium tinctorium]|uniref:Baculoviral IAP repeat-containing protein 7-like protein n=1 Tax=Dinothrombium tinctorium TaxID=1965070 RepID=A0A3S3NWI3_9ACAR|nr:baculoviral IAP repeat-containing protein 7-like protein [Dinothrombium tinctorium]
MPIQNVLDLSAEIYQNLHVESFRLMTYADSDFAWVVSKESLARACFYCLRNGDRVCCAFCKMVVFDWPPEDDPVEDHRKHNPCCRFVRGLDVRNKPIISDPFKKSIHELLDENLKKIAYYGKIDELEVFLEGNSVRKEYIHLQDRLETFRKKRIQ